MPFSLEPNNFNKNNSFRFFNYQVIIFVCLVKNTKISKELFYLKCQRYKCVRRMEEFIKQEGNVSHILNIEVSSSKQLRKQIYSIIYKIINNTPMTFTVEEIPVSISWISSEKSKNYFSNNPMFTDYIIEKHTKILQKYICNQYNLNENDVSFIVTKPLSRKLLL